MVDKITGAISPVEEVEKINEIIDNLGGRIIGEIITSTIPLTDSGLHLLDGALISGSGIYADFVTYIASLYIENILHGWFRSNGEPQYIYTRSATPQVGDDVYDEDKNIIGTVTSINGSGEPSYNGYSYHDESLEIPIGIFETEANWQTSVTTYGVCGKFVYDSVNNTVRLPKITGKLDGTTDITALGDLVEQYIKLPKFQVGYYQGRIYAGSPYVSMLTGNNLIGNQDMYASGNADSQICYFDSENVSNIYSGNGTNTKIHEQAINVLYYIVIANITKTSIQVDVDEIATDLNGKADVDLSNINASQIAKENITSWGVADYSASVSMTNPYTCPKNGFVLVGGNSGQAQSWSITRNGSVITMPVFSTYSSDGIEVLFPVLKNDVITATNTYPFIFYPMKGV